MKYVAGQPIVKPKLLLGEGVEEWAFFSSMVSHLGISDVQVDQFGGKSRIAEGLRSLTKRSGFLTLVRSVAIVRDADFANGGVGDQAGVAASAFDSVLDALRYAKLPVPNRLGEAIAGPPQVTVFVMPDCGSAGMLEDLCYAAASDAERDCVSKYLACLETTVGRTQPTNQLPKARSRAWLAGQVPPDLSLGVAASHDFWRWDRPAFDRLKSWVRSV